MRVHDEPVAVLFDDAPRQFIWRGRLLVVTRVQSRWFRSLPWWRTLPEDAGTPLLVEQEHWRCEAGTAAGTGVYDLVRTEGQSDWRLQAVMD